MRKKQDGECNVRNFRNTDFECWYIRTHTKEKLSKISNITFAIFAFLPEKKNTQTKWPSGFFGIYYSR